MGIFLVHNKKIVAAHKDFHKLKTAKFDLFRAHYHAGLPMQRKAAREYCKLSGGFFVGLGRDTPACPGAVDLR